MKDVISWSLSISGEDVTTQSSPNGDKDTKLPGKMLIIRQVTDTGRDCVLFSENDLSVEWYMRTLVSV